MKKYKSIVIVVIILAIYSVVMFLVFGNKSTNNNDNSNQNNSSNKSNKVDKYYYLVIGNESRLRYDGNNFETVSKSTIENNGKYNVFINGEYLGDYAIKMGSVWNIFDDDNSFVNYDGDLIASSLDLKLKIRNFGVKELDDEDKNYLKNKYGINSFDNYTHNELIDYDFDHNGQRDRIIIYSKLDYFDNDRELFSLVIMKYNEEYYSLIEEKGDDAHNIYTVSNIINILDRNVDSFILNKTYGAHSENPEVSNMVYSLKNNSFVVE